MSDTKAAAERLRMAFDNDELSADLDELFDIDSDVQISRDLFTVARAYVAEHLTEDDEPITEDWWDSLNESHEVDSDNDIVIGEYFVSFNRDWANTGISVQSIRDDMQFPNITTRGQLRKLLEALQ